MVHYLKYHITVGIITMTHIHKVWSSWDDNNYCLLNYLNYGTRCLIFMNCGYYSVFIGFRWSEDPTHAMFICAICVIGRVWHIWHVRRTWRVWRTWPNVGFVSSVSSGDSVHAGGVATFVCICDPKSRFRGSLSAIMEEPLSTIPLHMVINGQVSFAI